MQNNIFILFLFLFSTLAISQEKFNVYNPEIDAEKQLSEAVDQAKSSNKHVLVQVGGNWCGWCKLFHDLTTTDSDLQKYISDNYVVMHLNYSKENKNLEVLEKLEFPQRFGFPVFVILDGNGKRLHTQNSGYLEEGEGHSKKKVLEFLQAWSPAAVNPINYPK